MVQSDVPAATLFIQTLTESVLTINKHGKDFSRLSLNLIYSGQLLKIAADRDTDREAPAERENNRAAQVEQDVNRAAMVSRGTSRTDKILDYARNFIGQDPPIARDKTAGPRQGASIFAHRRG